MCTSRSARPDDSRGISLVELIVFIVIVSVGLVGILSVLNLTVQHSADPMERKQMLALAESLLEEVTLMPFTYCDPDDPNAPTAADSASCTGGSGGANDESKTPLGSEVGESRGGVTPYDNVSDYNGLSLPAVTDAAGNHAYAGYAASIAVADTSAATANRLGGITADADVLQVTVTVTHGAESMTLHGYRTRHSPTLLP